MLQSIIIINHLPSSLKPLHIEIFKKIIEKLSQKFFQSVQEFHSDSEFTSLNNEWANIFFLLILFTWLCLFLNWIKFEILSTFTNYGNQFIETYTLNINIVNYRRILLYFTCKTEEQKKNILFSPFSVKHNIRWNIMYLN